MVQLEQREIFTEFTVNHELTMKDNGINHLLLSFPTSFTSTCILDIYLIFTTLQ